MISISEEHRDIIQKDCLNFSNRNGITLQVVYDERSFGANNMQFCCKLWAYYLEITEEENISLYYWPIKKYELTKWHSCEKGKYDRSMHWETYSSSSRELALLWTPHLE